MQRRILVVDDSRAFVTALRRDLEDAGREVDHLPALPPALGVVAGTYGVAVVRAGARTADLVAALRRADPLLPVLAIALEEEHAKAETLGVDAVLAAPVTPSAVACACELSEQLRNKSERIATLEARQARAGRAERDFDFLKKLLLIEVRRSRRYGFPLSLAVLGVDRWDEVVAGTPARARAELLAELLALVTRSLRDIDIALPLTDERIVVLMPHTKGDGGMRVARRLCAQIRDRTAPPKVTVSVGMAAHGGDGTVSFGSLVRRAGEALVRARAAGGDRAEAAEPPKKRDRVSIG
jgi:PleD family two-component response regulator